MLGTTARKLRILGFDSLYDSKSQDKDLVQKAASSGRILLTSDFELYALAKNSRVNAIFVDSTNEKMKLFQVLIKSGVRQVRVGELASRCSLCNGELFLTDETSPKNGKIYHCFLCRKNYWYGSHWKKMGLFFEEVNSLLAANMRAKFRVSDKYDRE